MTNSNMTCEAFDAALPDYLEGTLGDSMRAPVEMHLRECVRCAGLVRDLENIQRDASALPDLVPARDLWEGIEARIAAPVIHWLLAPRREKLCARLAGIAAAALVTTAGITYTLTERSLDLARTSRQQQLRPRQRFRRHSRIHRSTWLRRARTANAVAVAPRRVESGARTAVRGPRDCRPRVAEWL